MRTKRRNALPLPVGLFEPPPPIPHPGAQALEDAQSLLQQLLTRLVVGTEDDAAMEAAASSLQHQRQHGRDQSGQRQPDGPERDAFDQTEPRLD